MFEIRNLLFLRQCLKQDDNTYIFQITAFSNYKDFVEYESTQANVCEYIASIMYKKQLELHIRVNDVINCVFINDKNIMYDIKLNFSKLLLQKPIYDIIRVEEKELDISEEDMDEDRELNILLDESEIHNLCELEKEKLREQIYNVNQQISSYTEVINEYNSVDLLKKITELNMNFKKNLKKNNI
jgi:hypothetical protein